MKGQFHETRRIKMYDAYIKKLAQQHARREADIDDFVQSGYIAVWKLPEDAGDGLIRLAITRDMKNLAQKLYESKKVRVFMEEPPPYVLDIVHGTD